MPRVNTHVTRQEMEKYQAFTLGELLAQGERLMTLAGQDGAAHYAPLHYAEALSLWQQAQALHNAPQQRQTAIGYIAAIEKISLQIKPVAAEVQGRLHAQFALLTDIQAWSLSAELQAEFNATQGLLRGLAGRIEVGQGAWLGQEPARALDRLNTLLVAAQRYQALHETELQIKHLRALGADKHIPKTLRALRTAVREAGDYIQRYPKNTLAIQRWRNDLAQQVRHAQGLLTYVKENEARARLAFEQLALEEEQRLLRIGAAMGATDLGATLTQMTDILTTLAQRLAATDGAEARVALAQELGTLKNTLQQLQAEKAALAQQRPPSPSTPAEPPLPPPLVTP